MFQHGNSSALQLNDACQSSSLILIVAMNMAQCVEYITHKAQLLWDLCKSYIMFRRDVADL